MFDNAVIRDYVLPLVEAKKTQNGYEFKKFHGTCFLINPEGFALTNSHLLGSNEGNVLCVMIINDDTTWSVFEIEETETHPSEDLALLKITNLKDNSFMKISGDSEYSSCPYMQWSYPEEIVTELVEGNSIAHRPDLVYLEGYVRRRLNDVPLPGILGNLFYEVSEAGTLGCSGSPIIKKPSGANNFWGVIGIYVGSRKTQDDEGYSSVGYALRSDAFGSWKPNLLPKTLIEY